MLAAIALGILLAGCAQNTDSTPIAVPVVPVASSSESSSSAAALSAQSSVTMGNKYINGTYSATGHYFSPEGQESVDVSLTLKDGVIANATFTGNATNRRSMMMQDQFAAGFREQVVGKSIDELSLSVVNGSSLTPQGFMDAVQQIKAQAQAKSAS